MVTVAPSPTIGATHTLLDASKANGGRAIRRTTAEAARATTRAAAAATAAAALVAPLNLPCVTLLRRRRTRGTYTDLVIVRIHPNLPIHRIRQFTEFTNSPNIPIHRIYQFTDCADSHLLR
jgi:hypothetical protein